MARSEKELTEVFRRLGASDPEAWAQSEVLEDFPQLARYLFLKQAWEQIVDETDTDWPKRTIAETQPDSDLPYAGMGRAMRRLLECGADPQDIVDVVRSAQAQFLFSLGYLIDDARGDLYDLDDLSWGLFETDEDGLPGRSIAGLHESVLETDPTGREMRPRKS